MANKKKRILGISGSLRTSSSNGIIIRIVRDRMPDDVEFIIYDGLGSLPHFDDSPHIPAPVAAFRQLVKEVDAVFICTPEYAFGVPGSLKNALDWTVGSGDFDQKLLALVTASSVGDKGHAALLNTLQAIGASIPDGASLLISFVRSKLNGNGEITDDATSKALQVVIDALLSSIPTKKK